jgi:CubicO group peptidase (beta-lactamase class C family)
MRFNATAFQTVVVPMPHPLTRSFAASSLSKILIGGLLFFACLTQQLNAYDFTGLTQLASGALTGENVNQPVAGFEIRLLQRGVPIYHQVFGDWSVDRPANADSSSKTMSGALMMSLVDSGEMGFSLDSHLSDYLAEYNTATLGNITIRQAFSHTSGIAGEDAGSLILLNPFISLREAARQISQQPLAHGPPGSTFAYGGLSMQAAGAAAEVATGERYIDLFADRIAGPLALADTQFVLASNRNPRVAGGIESTASDYSRFMDMLLNRGIDRATGQQILSAESVAEMLTRQTTDDQPIANSPVDNNRYGIGVWIDQLGQAGPTVDAIAGGARGFHSWIDQSADLVFTFATDLSSFQNVEVLSSMMHNEILQAIGIPGDYDHNDEVDIADYNLWKQTFGTNVLPFEAADGNGNAKIDAADYTIWRDSYAADSQAITAIPEPSAAILLLSLTVYSLLCCGRFENFSTCAYLSHLVQAPHRVDFAKYETMFAAKNRKMFSNQQDFAPQPVRAR